jgi:hypothetical protein
VAREESAFRRELLGALLHFDMGLTVSHSGTATSVYLRRLSTQSGRSVVEGPTVARAPDSENAPGATRTVSPLVAQGTAGAPALERRLNLRFRRTTLDACLNICRGKTPKPRVAGHSVGQSARSSDAGSLWATSRWTCCRCGRHERHQHRPPPGWAWQMGGLRCANCRQSARVGAPLPAARKAARPRRGNRPLGTLI